MTIHKEIPGVEYWYDPHTRCWFCARVDADGNLGQSDNSYTRAGIIKLAKWKAAE